MPNLAIGDYDFGASHEVLGITLPGFANYYFIELILLTVAILGFTRLNDSRIGRAWVAIREDEVAAAAMGVDTVRLKLLAFAIGAFMAGAAGTVNAHVTTQVSPDSYTFLESILLVAAVVLGGMGSVPGALLGSAALFIVPEKLRAFQDKRLLLFGAALHPHDAFPPRGHRPQPAPAAGVPGGRGRGPVAGRGHRRPAGDGHGRGAMTGTQPTGTGATGAEPILQARKVTKRFGGLVAVHEVDLDVGEAEIVGLSSGPTGRARPRSSTVSPG